LEPKWPVNFDHNWSFVQFFCSCIQQSCTVNKVKHPADGDIVSELPVFRKCSPRCLNLNVASASQSPRTLEATSTAYLHLPHPGMSASPSLNRRLFKWQCPVSSLVNILGWFQLRYLHLLRTFLNNAFFYLLRILVP
jgi:hypothetical protein